MFEGSEHLPRRLLQAAPAPGRQRSMARPRPTARTTSSTSPPPTSSWPWRWNRTGWAICSRPSPTTSSGSRKTSSRTNTARITPTAPMAMVWRLLAEALYPPDHPYSWLTIGVMEDVEAATRDDVEAFFRRFYVPSNASLCLVGDIDEDRGPRPGRALLRPDSPAARRRIDPWAPGRPRWARRRRSACTTASSSTGSISPGHRSPISTPTTPR